MKHKLDGPVDVNVNLEFDVEDVESVIDKVTECVVIVIGVATAAHILKRWFT